MRRRDFLAKLGLTASVATLPIEIKQDITVYDEQDFIEVPTFQNGMRIDAEPFNAMSRAIIQLQNEVDRLRRGRD